MTIKAKRVRVLLTRTDLNTTCADVFEHEIPILLAVFGAGNVTPLEDVELEPAELEDGIDGEYARLLRKYKRPNDTDSPAAQVFAGASALANALGVKYQAHTGLSPTMPESLQYDGKAEAAKPKRGRPPKAAEEAGDE
jgi:hypothetical protein